MEKQELSFKIATRLKNLREAKGYSYDDVKRLLKDKYSVTISRDSIRNYEIDSEHRSRSVDHPNLRMSAEYLRAFADLYGVSTDYLLGRAELRSPDPDLNVAAECTGLDEAAIKILADMSAATRKDVNTINLNYPERIQRMINYFIGYSDYNEDDLISLDGLEARCGKDVMTAYKENLEEDLNVLYSAIAFENQLKLDLLNLLISQETDLKVLENLAAYIFTADFTERKLAGIIAADVHDAAFKAIEFDSSKLSAVFLVEAEQGIKKAKDVFAKYKILDVENRDLEDRYADPFLQY